MKKKILLPLIIFTCFSCSSSNDKTTGLIAEASNQNRDISTYKNDAGYLSFKEKFLDFSSKLSYYYLLDDNAQNSSLLSPLSIFMMLLMNTEITTDESQQEILDALDLSYEEIKTYTPYFYSELNKKSVVDGNSVGLDIFNSLWLNKNINYNEDVLNTLANDYYCSSYEADFRNDNEHANKYVKEYIEDKSRGLLTWNHKFGYDTVLVLLNLIYLKDFYNSELKDLFYRKLTFTNADNISQKYKFLYSDYIQGQVRTTSSYSMFYISTLNNYKIKFILPLNNNTVYDILTPSLIKEVNDIKDFETTSTEGNTHYQTRCIFPMFTSESEKNIISLLEDNFSINSIFDRGKDSFNKVVSVFDNTYINDLIHKTKIVLNENGIEASTVTAQAVDGITSIEPNNIVYNDFYVDHSFIYILTDNSDNIIFSGVVNSLE